MDVTRSLVAISRTMKKVVEEVIGSDDQPVKLIDGTTLEWERLVVTPPELLHDFLTRWRVFAPEVQVMLQQIGMIDFNSLMRKGIDSFTGSGLFCRSRRAPKPKISNVETQ